MKCPKCGAQAKLRLEITGGCQGHHDGYCYCDALDVHAFWICRTELRTPIRKLFLGYCQWASGAIPALSDKDSMERWIADRMKEDE